MKVFGIDNVLFAVGDLDQAVEFYHAKLGLPVKFEVPQIGIAAFRLGDEEPGILVRAQAETTPRVWLEVDDARRTAEELKHQGIEPLKPPFELHTGWAFEVADPWGNVIGFTDYTKDRSLARRAR
jgi:predicted enzyme related to lactoylglutathione lyase